MSKLKVLLLPVAVCAAAMLLAYAPVASAVDPQEANCKGLGVGLKNIDVKIEPAITGQASSFKGGVLLCGSDLNVDDPSKSKGYKSGKLTFPWGRRGEMMDKGLPEYARGVITRCANPKFANDPKHIADCDGVTDLKSGQYMGSVGMGISTAGGEIALDGQLAKIYVGQAPGTDKENALCTVDAIACYQGIDELGIGYSDMVVRKIPKSADQVVDTYVLEIGEIHLLIELKTPNVYYTRIGYPEIGKPIDLCAYAGAVNGDKCGDPASGDWVQKNGPVGTYTCNVLKWALMGWLKHTYDGVGVLVDVDTNVPGAMDYWGTNLQEDWYQDLEARKEVAKYKLEYPFCGPVTVSKAGASKPGSAGRRSGGSSSDDAESRKATPAHEAKGSAHKSGAKKKPKRKKRKHSKRKSKQRR